MLNVYPPFIIDLVGFTFMMNSYDAYALDLVAADGIAQNCASLVSKGKHLSLTSSTTLTLLSCTRMHFYICTVKTTKVHLAFYNKEKKVWPKTWSWRIQLLLHKDVFFFNSKLILLSMPCHNECFLYPHNVNEDMCHQK